MPSPPPPVSVDADGGTRERGAALPSRGAFLARLTARFSASGAMGMPRRPDLCGCVGGGRRDHQRSFLDVLNTHITLFVPS